MLVRLLLLPFLVATAVSADAVLPDPDWNALLTLQEPRRPPTDPPQVVFEVITEKQSTSRCFADEEAFSKGFVSAFIHLIGVELSHPVHIKMHLDAGGYARHRRTFSSFGDEGAAGTFVYMEGPAGVVNIDAGPRTRVASDRTTRLKVLAHEIVHAVHWQVAWSRRAFFNRMIVEGLASYLQEHFRWDGKEVTWSTSPAVSGQRIKEALIRFRTVHEGRVEDVMGQNGRPKSR